MTECQVDSCDRRVFARGWCQRHYGRWQRHGDPLAPKRMTGAGPVPVDKRFWSKVNMAGPGDCWEWTGSRSELGYGQVRYEGRTTKAHRVVWLITIGQIPAGLCVLHSCDNPPCVKPAHLFLGTLKDNSEDAVAKGRTASGEAQPGSKLTAADVAVIRASTERQAVLARRHGISQANVSMIRRGQRWKTPPTERQST